MHANANNMSGVLMCEFALADSIIHYSLTSSSDAHDGRLNPIMLMNGHPFAKRV